jgi:hypothetical protein
MDFLPVKSLLLSDFAGSSTATGTRLDTRLPANWEGFVECGKGAMIGALPMISK